MCRPRVLQSVPEQEAYLLLDKVKLAKAEFDKLETLGIIHGSSSPWASPLYMVPKGSSLM